jgi:hypothetical protein
MGWPGEQILTKMWESLDKVGTGLATPGQIKREGRARYSPIDNVESALVGDTENGPAGPAGPRMASTSEMSE